MHKYYLEYNWLREKNINTIITNTTFPISIRNGKMPKTSH